MPSSRTPADRIVIDGQCAGKTALRRRRYRTGIRRRILPDTHGGSTSEAMVDDQIAVGFF